MLKRLFLIVVAIALLAVAGRVFFLTDSDSKDKENTVPVLRQEPITADPSAQEIIPLTFSIPKINISANVEHVGLDNKRNMDVPKKDENVAWYKLGYKPGQKGNSVIAGHFDTKKGTPAVFYNLSSLSPGDEIFVKDSKGKHLKFIVTGKEIYDFDKFPIEKVFGEGSEERLNLITCDGVFDKKEKTYSKRLVVFSKLAP